ncbi:MAG: hypothetical protein V4760_16865 [Bdellovibrionota bacterium]
MKARFLSLAVAILFSSQAHAAGAFNTGGGCYNLQLIKNTSKSQPLTDSNRHTIFLGAKTQINLVEGSFGVLDGNGTDGSAQFRLPNPDPSGTGASAYSVFARVVGKPGSGIDLTTCGVAADGSTYCNTATDVLSMTRKAGTSTGQNVSRQLLTITADIDGDGDLETIPLFSDDLESYYWDVDAFGRAHAQLRFCPVSTQLY